MQMLTIIEITRKQVVFIKYMFLSISSARVMDQGLLDASVIFGKPADLHEISIIKPEFMSLLAKIEVNLRESAENYCVFEILNTLAVEYRFLIRSDLDILVTFVKVITELLKTNLPEQYNNTLILLLNALLCYLEEENGL